MSEPNATEGTIVRGSDGSLYFLRKELMEAAKVSEPHMQDFLNGVLESKGSASRTAIHNADVTHAVPVRGAFDVGEIGRGGWAAESTVMCPGTLNDSEITVLPAANELAE